MAIHNSPQLKQLSKIVKTEGYTVAVGKGGHHVIKNTLGDIIYQFASTPSDAYWADNTIKDLVNEGYLPEKWRGTRIH